MRIDGIYHTGFVVADLERAVAFYSGTLGLNVERAPGELEGEWIASVVGFGSVRLRMAYVGAGDGHSIELLEYVDPPGDKGPHARPRNDVGAAHAAMLVDDIHAWHDRLTAAGVNVLNRPRLRDAAYPWARYAMYFQDPDGNWLEMVERAPKPPGSREN